MLPHTHAFFLRAAVEISGTWTRDDLDDLVRGDRHEDDFVVPVVGVHLRAPGLTHTYRPGKRFGELFAENARSKLERFVRRSKQSDRRTRAFWLGRACHLLGDMAVPARTRGVWHLEGDPLEAKHTEMQKELERVRDIAETWFALSELERNRYRSEFGG